MEKQKINGLISQETFNWYQLSPTYASILLLEEVFDKIKPEDYPKFLSEQEEKIDYKEFIGAQWMYRYDDGRIYCIIIILPKSIEIMAMKDGNKGKKTIELIEKNFLKEW